MEGTALARHPGIELSAVVKEFNRLEALAAEAGIASAYENTTIIKFPAAIRTNASTELKTANARTGTMD